MQILPFPIPHLIPSAPYLIKFYAPYPVATEPDTISIVGNFYLSYSVAVNANLECPFATSITKTSQPAYFSISALYI
jgi:hypothetical protein